MRKSKPTPDFKDLAYRVYARKIVDKKNRKEKSVSKSKPTLDLNDLDAAAGETHNPVEVLQVQQAGKSRKRIGKVAIQGWFEKSFRTRFKRLALDRGVTCEAQMEEALTEFLNKHGV